MPNLTPGEEVLFTRQRHDAFKAGLHYDIRIVAGDKAYSWATRKELPGPGETRVLFEQPVHTKEYALTPHIVIPKGQYGGGDQVLIDAIKAKILPGSTPDYLKMSLKDGRSFLIKKMDNGKYGSSAWLFRHIDGNQYLTKIAAEAKKGNSKFQLDPHQISALEQLDRENGLVLHHSMGSKKTSTFLTAIARAQARNPNGRSLIVAPASLTTNIGNEVKKLGLKVNLNNVDVMSYQMATNRAEQLRKNKYDVTVADESHGLRNTKSKRTQALRDILSSGKQRILATGTGNYNNLADISSLINIASGEDILPENEKDMRKMFVHTEEHKPGFIGRLKGEAETETEELHNKKKLKSILNKYVNFYESGEDPKAAKYFPKVTEKTIDVEMSPEQEKYYNFAQNKLPFITRMRIRHNLPLSKQEMGQFNSFSSGVRQVSVGYRHLQNNASEKGGYTPKIEKAVENLQKGMKEDPNFKALVYSEYLEAGANEYSRKLKELGIQHAIYNGSLSREEKDKMLADYNSGKNKVMILSSAGAEGISAKGTKAMQILTPHWNRAKTDQIKGRAVRFKSHEHLPENERTVSIENYHSTLPKPTFGKAPTSIDQYLAGMSDTKGDLFDKVKKLMETDNKKGPIL